MRKRNIRRRYVTLIEMMIVMFIIAMIIGILGYNYKGFLDKSKAFKTKAGVEKLEDFLNLRIAESPRAINDITSQWETIVKNSHIVKNPNDLIYDGWGEKYQVELEKGNVHVHSKNLEEYQKQNATFGE